MHIEIKASEQSISRRKLIFGVATNDAWYRVVLKVKGVKTRCPYYSRWLSMIARCYYDDGGGIREAYKGCSVCDEWLMFSNFRSWMKMERWEGLELDKDIIKPGNKIYSPESCCFVSKRLNGLLVGAIGAESRYKGFRFIVELGKYRAVIRDCGKSLYIGDFSTAKQARSEYVKMKCNFLKREIAKCDNPSVVAGLLSHIKIMKQE